VQVQQSTVAPSPIAVEALVPKLVISGDLVPIRASLYKLASNAN